MGYVIVMTAFVIGLFVADRTPRELPRGHADGAFLPKHRELRYLGQGRWGRHRTLRERGADRLRQLTGWLREHLGVA